MIARIIQRLFDVSKKPIITNLPRSIQRDIGLIDGLPDGVLHRSR